MIDEHFSETVLPTVEEDSLLNSKPSFHPSAKWQYFLLVQGMELSDRKIEVLAPEQEDNLKRNSVYKTRQNVTNACP